VKEDSNDAKAIYDYEPDEETILKDLLPKNVSIQIFKVLLESDAGEHGAKWQQWIMPLVMLAK
jgi:F-type H+-transporting ATPase subunit gamma